MEQSIPLTVEFTYVFAIHYQDYTHLTHYSGGLELLFSNQRKHKVLIPVNDDQKRPSNVSYLIQHLCNNLMKDPRKEMFVIDDSV